jgi:hypothetical protein
MSKSANLGLTIGVLSGVCTIDDLSPGADHVIENIDHMLPLIMPRHFDSSNRSTSHSGKLSSVQYDKVRALSGAGLGIESESSPHISISM